MSGQGTNQKSEREWKFQIETRKRRNEQHRLTLEKLNPLYEAAQVGKVTYGSLPVKSAILINAGALLVFPAFISAIEISSLVPVKLAFWSFALGILTAALSSFFAYLNFGAHSSSAATAIGIDHFQSWNEATEFESPEIKTWSEDSTKEMHEEYEALYKRMDTTNWGSIIFGFLSYILFIIGCALVSLNDRLLLDLMSSG